MLIKDLVASTRVTYPHHWPVGDVLGRARCSLRTRLPTLQPSSWDWRAAIDRAHVELYLSWNKTQFRIDTTTQACTWTKLRLPLHVHVLYVHVCIQKVFCGSVKKVYGRPIKMRSVGLVETETFLVWPKLDMCAKWRRDMEPTILFCSVLLAQATPAISPGGLPKPGHINMTFKQELLNQLR